MLQVSKVTSLNSFSIMTVQHLQGMTQARIDILGGDKEFKMTKNLIQKCHHNALKSWNCNAPPFIDHHLQR